MLVYIKPLSLIPKLHSDRLFGAILSAISELYPSDFIEKLNKKFCDNNPPFLISSSFPALNTDDGKIRFYPKIVTSKMAIDSISIDILKKYKKVEFLEESIFFNLIKGKISENDILENYGEYLQVKNFLIPKNIDLEFNLKKTIIPNNSINRLTNETEIFYSEGITYGKSTSLFFFIEILNSEYESVIRNALLFLRDRGFGGNISVGKGHFDYEIEDVSIEDLNFNQNASFDDKFLTLSRFIPTEEDLTEIMEYSNYEIGFKRSRDKNGEIRKQVRFFNEGSSFSNYKPYRGKMVSVGDKMPAIEYGYAFPLIYKEKGD